MRVLQLVGFAFEGAVERAREIQLVRSDNLAAAALGSSSAALNQLERHRLRQSGGGTMARPADLHCTVYKRQPGAPPGTGFGRRQVEHPTVHLGPVRRHREQVRATRASADKLAVTAGPREQRKFCIRQAHPSLIEVTLAIGDQGHLLGVGKRCLGAAAKISSGITDRLAGNLPNATLPARSPQTVHDRALLFHKSPGQKPPFCPTFVPKSADKQIHERNHLHPPKNQSQMTENSLRKPSPIKATQPRRKCVHGLAREGGGRDPRCACVVGG